ncbi:tRNA uridine-5-carboxymethylaminomethyl(34) synthesis GTPase MnmE [Erythrobacter sp. HL-111]|uniref:tRNA uridine-5-carboxymethylaminomethyl(34) synthesis GTPase MnmE n=1 Tax=Erythrobacter sp. HL-111 TaxID=1798193 RepID=UPI0006D9CDE9|nr:tRNA uridine-5-carboxymethylaminomethyl(34) synthesis GTPase MnmE [Erythrobacter sp. HL-111]KPP90645.1 MAG: tRNA modification GTPase trmE [Erythrobacteraceae bacterium HL-111]SDS75425.1 tRNA modification GTPase trmE [Erythrobacter sp. HL-111]
MSEASTIFAVSSGAPPAAIGVIRVSGPQAAPAIEALCGRLPEPRRASLARLRDGEGALLDVALVLWFPGPASATGEDLAEFHCHGGRALLAAVERALARLPGLRAAEAGEFTRRAFANGRIDLAEAEGLADLLAAETELQRAAAIANASGALSRQVDHWRSRLLGLSAQLEAALDFSDEEDAAGLPECFTWNIERLAGEIGEWLARPRSERLGEGFRVVLAGPPNSGKSTLFNALVESEAAITSPVAGTTRDVIERSVAIGGVAFTFVDTAGLREIGADAVESIGIERARGQLGRADLVLWLGEEGAGPSGAWEIAARADAADFRPKRSASHRVSAETGEGLAALKRDIADFARERLPRPGEAALNRRQHARLAEAAEALTAAKGMSDLLLIGEELRRARVAFDRLTGRATTEDMLDALFGRFCIGK